MTDKLNSKLFALTILSFFACYYRLFVRLFNMWMRDSRMDYLPFVILLFGVLVSERYKKGVQSQVKVKGVWFGIPVIGIGLLCDIVGLHTSIMSLEVISFIITLSGAVMLIAGFRWYRYFFLPGTLLVFLLPVPYYIEIVFGTPLRLIATKIAVASLSMIGFAIKSTGNIILLASGDELIIDTACSGIRTITALLASTIFIGAFLKRWRCRVALVVVAALTAIGTNALRVSCLVLLSMSEGKGILDTPVHEMTGILTFILALVIIFSTGRYINANNC